MRQAVTALEPSRKRDCPHCGAAGSVEHGCCMLCLEEPTTREVVRERILPTKRVA